MNHPSLRTTAAILALCGVASASAALAAPGYTSIYGGGPLYKHVASNITEIQNAGFNEVIVWSVEVTAAGDLNLNGEFPLTSGGVYVGNNTWPNFAADLTAMKQGTPKRITFTVGSSNANPSDFDHVKSLVQTQGTGPTSTLYKSFLALKQALPSVDAIDFDDESTYDAATMTQFAVMLGNLGYHVTMSPYTNAAFWTSVVSNVNAQLPGTVDGVHLQAYSGGAGNSPCSGWNFGSVSVFPGLWDANTTPPAMQAQMQNWKTQCGITGGFLWLYDDIAGKTYNGQNAAKAYAGAINNALGINTYPAGAYDVQAMSGDGLDKKGYAYSANLLGTSTTFNGVTYNYGAANANDAVSAAGQAIPLPAGRFASLRMMATAVGGNQASQVFKVNYTDGTSATFTQSMSDWFTPQSYAGEIDAVPMSYRDTNSGGRDSRTFHLYNYTFALNGAKTVQSVVLPNNASVEVLAMTLVP